MKVVVDTNIVFSAILKANSSIAKILTQPTSEQNFYATPYLLIEIERHRNKLLKLSSYSESELIRVIKIVKGKIIFIDLQSIPEEVYRKAELLTADIDADDTGFVALAEHLNAKLWTGDKVLMKGLAQKGWNQFITTAELFDLLFADK